jgi:hypothetical protein
LWNDRYRALSIKISKAIAVLVLRAGARMLAKRNLHPRSPSFAQDPVGAGGAVDTNTVHSPIVGFIFDQRGLMYNLTLEGSKISRIYR